MSLSRLSSPNLENLLKFWDWMETTGRAEIWYFEASGRTLYELANCDAKDDRGIEEILHEKITNFIKIPDEKKEYFINESTDGEWNPEVDAELYNCYQLLKFLWLAQDIGGQNQQAPMQMIQSGRNYSFHPGSDKRIIITYLKPIRPVKCFYIWYPEMDQTPWIWTNEVNHLVKTPEQFVDMFEMADHPTFNIKYEEVTFREQGYDPCDNHFEPWAEGVHLGLRKWGKIKSDKFCKTVPTLSYNDGVHRKAMLENKDLLRTARFKRGVFQLGNFKFLHHRGRWTYAPDIHLPGSLVDSTYKTNRERAKSFSNTFASIGRYRTNM